jgi:hypothetical protein
VCARNRGGVVSRRSRHDWAVRAVQGLGSETTIWSKARRGRLVAGAGVCRGAPVFMH